jgi:hypothetical protein
MSNTDDVIMVIECIVQHYPRTRRRTSEKNTTYFYEIMVT